MHNTAPTSLEHFRTYDAAGWHTRILALMREVPEATWCVADMAKTLEAEKSTISARLNELCLYDEIEYVGAMPSNTTGIKAKHYRIKTQPSLL